MEQQKGSFKIVIEGNVGSGKSTILAKLKKYPNLEVIPEPVAAW